MSKIIRICLHCYDSTGDTFEFNSIPPIGATCDECGSLLQPKPPEEIEPEGSLLLHPSDIDYSEHYEADSDGRW